MSETSVSPHGSAQQVVDNLVAVLVDMPGTTARDIACAVRDPKMSRSDVNQVLYRNPDRFQPDSRTPPRWRVVERPAVEVTTEADAFDRLLAVLEGESAPTASHEGGAATERDPLRGMAELLRMQQAPFFEIEFAELELKTRATLPVAALVDPAWWANERTPDAPQSSTWLDLGWVVAGVDVGDARVTFRRNASVLDSRHGFPIDAWLEAKTQARDALAYTARRRSTISYSELVQAITSIRLDPDSRALSALLRELSMDEDFAGRGMLTVLVVHKDGDKMPGRGFFELAKELGRDTRDPLVCWATEMSNVHDAWKRRR